MKLTRIHRILEFRQEAWMRTYVKLCIDNRKLATSDFEKDFWKLAVNSVFGKSMENVRNHINVRLIHDPIAGIKAVAKPTFESSRIVNEDLVMVHMKKLRLMLDKPIYTGFAILDLSKVIMYDFHYNHIIKELGHENVKLLFTDTDSLCYHITVPKGKPNLYEFMKVHESDYDTSNFDSKHSDPLLKSLFSKTNNKELGKFKCETGSFAPSEFVGLRAKMYSLKVEGMIKQTAKGIKRSFIKHHITHPIYLNTLRTARPTEAQFLAFQSKNQQLKTMQIKKVGLSAYDDKRFILEDGISSYAYGHYQINKSYMKRGTKRPACEMDV
jgi:hypothetical protein